VSERIQEVAERANVPEDFVRQLVAAGALPRAEAEFGAPGAVRRARLLWSWSAAGLSVETVTALVNRGALSLAFLDAPVMDLPERLDRSYEQLAADRGVPMSFVQALHQSLGFAAPERRSATSPCGHPHRSCHLTGGRRLRRDCEPGGSDRFYAQAGQVVVNEETAHRSGDRQVWFDPLGAVELKGVAKPLPLYQAHRKS
jgi:hypothetical protein